MIRESLTFLFTENSGKGGQSATQVMGTDDDTFENKN